MFHADLPTDSEGVVRRQMLPAPATRHARSILRLPDKRTAWAIVLTARLDAAPPPLAGRIASLHSSVPIIGARLRGETWYPGEPPVVTGEPDTRAFHLEDEPPLRIAAGAGYLTVIGHHAAFDGRSLAAVARALLGGPLPHPLGRRGVAGSAPAGSTLMRALRPADRVAATGAQETFAARTMPVDGAHVTARLAEAAVVAVAAHNAANGERWNRIAISIGIGDQEIGNTASYRRVVVAKTDEVRAAVAAALASTLEPPELAHHSRWLMRAGALLLGRLSDSLLVSNLGVVDLPGAEAVEFYPVARGRSAVAIGAAALAGVASAGVSTVTLRAMHLAPGDAGSLLRSVTEHFAPA